MAQVSSSTSSLLLERLQQWVETQGEKALFSFLEDATGAVQETATYAEMDAKATALALHVLREGIAQRGDRVLIVYEPCLDFIAAFLACLKAGIIAVPVFPPDPSKLRKDMSMFVSVAQNSGATVALTSKRYDYATKMGAIKDFFSSWTSSSSSSSEWPELRWVATDAVLETRAAVAAAAAADQGPALPPPASDDVAFLQYTSGSTSAPKGVMITHANLAHNLGLIVAGLGANQDTVEVSWLPQYHDMGLIGSYLGCLFCGGTGYFMSPIAFIRNPVLWLEVVSRYRATHLQAPNFAFSLVTRKFATREKQAQQVKKKAPRTPFPPAGFDLSCVEHMINAAEPVEAEAMERFYTLFERFGLRRGVVYPTYGLAEHTVFVCSNGAARLVVNKDVLEQERVVREVDKALLWTYSEYETGLGGADEGTKTVALVGCGRPAESDGVDLRIVDPEELNELEEDKVGEIWIDSPSKAAGYWNMVEQSANDFHARIGSPLAVPAAAAAGAGGDGAGESKAVDVSEDGYLRTGDLGFIHDGELYICGRIKDLIIIRGRNHFPQDLERTAEKACEAELRPGCSAAIGVPHSNGREETLAIVAELRDGVNHTTHELDEVVTRIRNAITRAHGVAVAQIHMLHPRTISKTTSGKIARSWVLRALQGDRLESVHVWHDEETAVRSVQASDLGGEVVDAAAEAGAVRGAASGFATLRKRRADSEEADMLASLGGGARSAGESKGGELGDGEDVLDATQMEIPDIVSVLAEELAEHMELDAASIPHDAALSALGLDSMTGLGLISSLETRFGLKIPEEALFEPTATLTTTAELLHAGCKVAPPPVVVDTVRLARLARGPRVARDSPLRKERVQRCSTKADARTGTMPDGSMAEVMEMTPRDEALAMLFMFYFFGGVVWVPATMVAAWYYLPMPAALVVIGICIVLGWLVPSKQWPPGGVGSWTQALFLRYFSYRALSEVPIEDCDPCILAGVPHGAVPIGHALQVFINYAITGFDFHACGASVIFWFPVMGPFFSYMGYEDVSRSNMQRVLLGKHSMGLVPGGIAEQLEVRDEEEVIMLKKRYGFVKIALRTGVTLVPSYLFGNTSIMSVYAPDFLKPLSRKLGFAFLVAWGRLGLPIPRRAPLFGVTGIPIRCPQTDNPSDEMVREYHAKFVAEIERIFNKHKAAYGWANKKLRIV